MNCDKHPEREGIASCIICGRIMCEECRLRLGGKNYCQSCADRIFRERSVEGPVDGGMGALKKILIVFILIIAVLACLFYILYLVYLAPYYGSLQNVISILMEDPQRIIRFLSWRIGF